MGKALLLLFLAAGTIHAQGGREFMDWLKDYSPTGYFIIHDYETRANKPGDYKQHLTVTTSPVGATAVHEECHMRNGLNGDGGVSYYVGNLKDYKFARFFTPFNSKEMMPDIPSSLINFQTDVYISGAAGTPGAYSQTGGIYGIFEEWDAYVTEVKSTAEMGACFRDHFNTAKDWKDLAGEIVTSVWSNTEFRYFALRYILWAKKKYPDAYSKMLASNDLRQCYTYLAQLADLAITDWMAALKQQKMDTQKDNGFDWYWKFHDELQKQEYQDLEKALLIPSVSIAPRAAAPRGFALEGAFDLRGRRLSGRALPGLFIATGRN